MLSEVLVHLEHADLVFAAKDWPELFVSQDLALVRRVLQIVGLDVFPHLAHHFGAGQGGRADDGSELRLGLQRLRQSRVRFLGFAGFCHCINPLLCLAALLRRGAGTMAIGNLTVP